MAACFASARRPRRESCSSSSDSEYEELLASEDSGESTEEYDSPGEDSDADGNSFSSARQWTKINTASPSPAPPYFPFASSAGVQAHLDEASSPLECFELFFCEDVINKAVTETNRYAAQHLASCSISQSSRLMSWRPVTEADMKVFFGMLLLQGVVIKPQVQWYWTKRKVIETPIFGQVMSKARFLLIMKFLNFYNNESACSDTDHPCPKLRKVWPILEMLKERFKAIYTPEKNISIDESLLLFKGRLSWKQYIPLKRSRFGIKFFVLCKSGSGYIWDIIVYTGKDTVIGDGDCSMGTKVVMKLMNPLLDKGYCLTVDNFYTSPELVDLLVSRKTDVYGTVKPSRRDMPQLKAAKLKKGEVVAYQRGKCMALQWKDKKLVTLLSTVHDSSMCETENRKGEKLLKPKVVMDYNNTMGGVDKSDQLMSYYPSTRKRQKVYYKKIFRHLLDQAALNAYIVYRKLGGIMDHIEYRLSLIEALFTKYHDAGHAPRRGRPSTRDMIRLTARHFVSFLPPTEHKQCPTRRCVLCCKSDPRGDTPKKVRKETRYWCKDCGVALCVIPCFEVYHTKANI